MSTQRKPHVRLAKWLTDAETVAMTLMRELQQLPNGEWPDAVKRIKDEMDMHAVLGQKNKWVVFALQTGEPFDHAVYDSWNDAVKATGHNRDYYIYLEVQPDGMPYREAASVLDFARKLYAGGYRIPSPDWEHSQASVMPRTGHDRKRAARQLITGKPLLPPGIPYGNLPEIGRRNNG